MQLNKNFKINPDIAAVTEFLNKISCIEGWEFIWRTICDARGDVLHYAVNSPVGNITYQVHDLEDCLSMIMNDVKWLAECLDYGYIKESKDADV